MNSAQTTFDFGQAINHLKDGKLVTRYGWNGKGMFLFMRPSDEIPVSVVINQIKSLPQSVKDYFAKKDNFNLPENQGLTKVIFTPYICMKAADETIVNGWLASQTDMVATDWMIFTNTQ